MSETRFRVEYVDLNLRRADVVVTADSEALAIAVAWAEYGEDILAVDNVRPSS